MLMIGMPNKNQKSDKEKLKQTSVLYPSHINIKNQMGDQYISNEYVRLLYKII